MAFPTSVDRVVEAENEGTTVTVRVGGTLDGVAAAALVDTVRGELDRGPARVDIDLGALDGFNHDGLQALGTCQSLGANLPQGLHFRTEGGAGQDALLAAFTLDPDAPDGEQDPAPMLPGSEGEAQ